MSVRDMLVALGFMLFLFGGGITFVLGALWLIQTLGMLGYGVSLLVLGVILMLAGLTK